MTRDEIERLLALCEAATAGEWIAKNGIIFSSAHPFNAESETRSAVSYYRDEFRATGHLLNHDGDGAFIAAARTALPRALREVLRLREQLHECKCGQFPVHLTAERFQRAMEAEEECARLRRALDAAGIVLESND